MNPGRFHKLVIILSALTASRFLVGDRQNDHLAQWNLANRGFKGSRGDPGRLDPQSFPARTRAFRPARISTSGSARQQRMLIQIRLVRASFQSPPSSTTQACRGKTATSSGTRSKSPSRTEWQFCASTRHSLTQFRDYMSKRFAPVGFTSVFGSRRSRRRAFSRCG
jgi:hypothetical protein